MDPRSSDSPPYCTHKVIDQPYDLSEVSRLVQMFGKSSFGAMIDLNELDEPDSEEAVHTQQIVTSTRQRLFLLTNPKGGRQPMDVQNAQEFAVQQLDHYISFAHSSVNWETVCLPLCKIKTPEELHLSVKFLDGLIESFRQSDKEMEPTIKSILVKNPVLKEYFADMSTCDDEEVHYDKLQAEKKELVQQYRLLNHKIELISALKKKHHPLRQSVRPVMKFIRSVEENKKDAMDMPDQPRKKKQKTFTDIIGDYFGVTSD